MLYLSLTTRPERLVSDNFRQVYDSLRNQTYAFDLLIINLSINDFVYKTIPTYLQEDKRVIINKTIICGPCTKLIGSLDIIPNDAVVIVLDDDIVMRDCFIWSLYKYHQQNPTKIISSCITKRDYFTDVKGYGGFILTMTDTIRKLKYYYLRMPKCARYIDDTWFGWCFYKLGIDVIKGRVKKPWNTILDIPNTEMYPKWHELRKDTNRYWLTTKFLKYNSIFIGRSKSNTKSVQLNKHYSPDTKLNFIHSYKDTFKYTFNGNQLRITRTDKAIGWGQRLVAYV